MRISSNQIFHSNLSAMQRQQAELLESDLRITSGLRIMRPSDDPSGAVKILNLDSNLATVSQYERNAVFAESSLALEEQALAGATDALHRIRELSVQANNGTVSDRDKQSIAAEIGLRYQELLALANARDAQGEYLFGGNRVASPPFVAEGNAVSYRGDDGQRLVRIGEGAQVAVRDSGRAVFQEIAAGDGHVQVSADPGNQGSGVIGDFGLTGAFARDSYSVRFFRPAPGDPLQYEVLDGDGDQLTTGEYAAGNSIAFAGAQFVLNGEPAEGDRFVLEPAGRTDLFSIVKSIEQALREPAPNSRSRAVFHNAMGQGLAHLDQALDHLGNRRGEIGARLNSIETMKDINADFKLQLDTALSETRDLDYAEAISRFNQQLVSLQAAQQVFVKTSGLSLFQYL